MKSLIVALFLLVSSILNAEMTNGVFYVDKNIECHLISQNGAITTNDLVAGKTYMVGNTLLEMVITNSTLFYFSGGPLVSIASNSTFTINIFDQEINNLEVTPRPVVFGNHNLNMGISSGAYSIIYPNTNVNSSFIISTPYTSYELHGGKYFIQVSDKSSIVYVIEGTMNVHGDKKVNKMDKGKIATAKPVSTSILTSISTPKEEDVMKFSTSVSETYKKWSDVQFFIVNGRVIGIQMK